MSLIYWNSKYMTGIKQFDEHHQHLVSLINLTHDGIISSAPKEELEAVLEELAKYTFYHFTAEEHWMSKHNYPFLTEHKEEHEKFIRYVSELQQKHKSGITMIDMQILNFLTDWLVEHIMGTDADYGVFVATKGIPDGIDP